MTIPDMMADVNRTTMVKEGRMTNNIRLLRYASLRLGVSCMIRNGNTYNWSRKKTNEAATKIILGMIAQETLIV